MIYRWYRGTHGHAQDLRLLARWLPGAGRSWQGLCCSAGAKRTRKEKGSTVDLGADRALFSISVTSELTDVNPGMLRLYEQRGLLAPHRTEGGTRRYSAQDLDRIREISTLLAAGLNLAGVEQVLHLRSENDRLRGELDQFRSRSGHQNKRTGPGGRS